MTELEERIEAALEAGNLDEQDAREIRRLAEIEFDGIGL